MNDPAQIAASLATVDRLINAIGTDLRNAPDWKIGTRWHDDRVKERRRLMSQRDTLLARQIAAAELN
jgi:hypothetical protein